VDVEEGVVAAVMPGHDGAGPAVRLGDGRVRRADLIVVADGARSRLRGQVVPGPALGAVRVVEVVGHLHAQFIAEALGPRFLKLQDPRGRRAAGVLPSGAGGVIWFAQVAADELPAAPLDPAALAAWVGARFGDWAGPIPALLASADPAQRYLWRAADLDPLPALHAAGVALVGDAGHPFLPFTSQGVSAALEDALALGDALAAAGPGAEGLQAGLAAYTAARLPVVSRIVAGGRALQDAFLRGSAASSPALTVPVVHP
jgi:2-polyprenyl-6-methoxyphenol hydroxylase-like FAD-dependent oxidoreductase